MAQTYGKGLGISQSYTGKKKKDEEKKKVTYNYTPDTGKYFGVSQKSTDRKTGSGRTVSKTYNHMDMVNPSVSASQKRTQQKKEQQKFEYQSNLNRSNTSFYDEKEDKNLKTDVSLNRSKGSLNYTKKQAEKERDKNNSSFADWRDKADKVTYKNDQERLNAIKEGRKYNTLRYDDYGLSEEKLQEFDAMFGNESTRQLAKEGAALYRSRKQTQRKVQKKEDEYRNAQFNYNQNVSNNYSKKALELDQQIKDIQSGKKKVDNANWEIQRLNNKRADYEAKSREYKQYAEYDDAVASMVNEMVNDKDAAKYIQRGKLDDNFIGKPNWDMGGLYPGSHMFDEEDSVKLAMMQASDKESATYQYIRGKYGDEKAQKFAEMIYEQGGLGNRYADYLGKQLDNPVYNTVQAFNAGAQNSIFGLRDAAERVTGADNVHVEGIMNKVYQQNVESGRLNKVVGDIAYNIGNMMPAIAVSVATSGIASPFAASAVAGEGLSVAGAVSAGVTGFSAFGNTYQQARREGFDAESATLYAVVNGASEAMLQYALNGIDAMGGGGVTKALADGAEKAIEKLCTKSVGKALLKPIIKQSINALGEFEEEYLQEILDPVFRNWALGEANGFEPFSEDALYAGLLGALSAGFMNSVQIAGENISYVKNGAKFQTTAEDLVQNAKDLPETADAKHTAEEFDAEKRDKNGKLKLSKLEAGILAQQQANAEALMSEIEKALLKKGISWNGLSDEARAMLVNPKNARYLASHYGIKINSKMSPQAIADEIKNKMHEDDMARGFIPINFQSSGVNQTYRASLNRICAKSNLDFYVSDNLDEGENARVIGNKIILSREAASTAEGIKIALTHEITHATELTQHYQALRTTVLRIFAKNGIDIENEINKKIAQYGAENRMLTREGALSEIVAEYAQNTFFEDLDSLVDFIASDRTLAQRMFSWFQERFNSTKPNTPEGKMLAKAMNNFRRAFNEIENTSTYDRLLRQNIISRKINPSYEPEAAPDFSESYPDLDMLREEENKAYDEYINYVMENEDTYRFGDNDWAGEDSEYVDKIYKKGDKLESKWKAAENLRKEYEEKIGDSNAETNGQSSYDELFEEGQSSIKSTLNPADTSKIDTIKKRRGWTASRIGNNLLVEDALIELGVYTKEQLAEYKKKNYGRLPFNSKTGWEKLGYKLIDQTDNDVLERPVDIDPGLASKIEQAVEAEFEIRKLNSQKRFLEKKLDSIYSGKTKVGETAKEISKKTLEIKDQISKIEEKIFDYESAYATTKRIHGDKGDITISADTLGLSERHARDYFQDLMSFYNRKQQNAQKPKLYAELLAPNGKGEFGLRKTGLYSAKQVYWDGSKKGAPQKYAEDRNLIKENNKVIKDYWEKRLSAEAELEQGQSSLKSTPNPTFDYDKPNPKDLIHIRREAKTNVSGSEIKKAFDTMKEKASIQLVDSLASFEGIDNQIAKQLDSTISQLKAKIQTIKNKTQFSSNPSEEIKEIKKQIEALRKTQKEVKTVYYTANNARNATSAADFTIGLDTSKQGTYQADFAGRKIVSRESFFKFDENGKIIRDEKGNAVLGDIIYDEKGNPKTCQNLHDIWAPIFEKAEKNPEYYKDFQFYLRLLDHIDRLALNEPTLPDTEQGRNWKLYNKTGITKKQPKPLSAKKATEQANALLEQYPEFEEIAKQVWQYNHNNLKYLMDSGAVSKESFEDLIEKHPHYVPADRDIDIKYGETAYNTNPVKSAKGSILLPFIPVDIAMADQTRKYIVAGRRNQLMEAVASAWDSNKESISNFVMDIEKEQILSEKEKLNEERVKQLTVEEIEKAFDPELDEKTNTSNKIIFYRNGVKHQATVSDGIYKGYTSLWGGMSDFERVVGAPTRALGTFFRNFVTNYNPVFIATNFLKDFGDAVFYSQDTGKFLKNYARAWKQIVNNGDVWQLYKATGGFNSSFFEIGQGANQTRNFFQRNFLDKIEKANLFVEQAPRLAEYMTSLEKAGFLDNSGHLASGDSGVMAVNEDGVHVPNQVLDIETLRKAMYDANDITVNFGRGGLLTKKINRSLVPFLNASVQGFSKITRQFQQRGGKAWARLAMKAAVLGVMPAVLNSLLYKDDDEWKHMTDWNKDNNYMFKLGDGKWIAIPRGRFMSFFAGLGNRAVQALNGDNVDWQSLGQVIETNIAPASVIDNNILAPIIRAINNKNWYGKPIDSYEDLKKRPEERYDETTSEICKAIGKALGLSPKRVQDLFESYTGFIADVVVPATNMKSDVPVLDTFTQKFVKDSVYSNDFSSNFREYKDSIQQAVNYEGESEVSSVLGFKLRYLNNQSKEIAKLYDAISELENSNASYEDKKEGVRAIRVRINLAYQSAVNNAELLEKKIAKYYKVDPKASIKVQQRQAWSAYAQAMNDLFGATEGLKAAGVSDETMTKLAKAGVNLDDYFKYYSKTHSGDKYFSTDNEGNTQSYSYAEKKQKLLSLKLDDKSLRKIYKNEFENSNTEKNKSIDYAVKNGVSATDFIKTAVAFGEIGKAELEEDDMSKTLQKKEWLLKNIKNTKSLETLYSMNFETENTDEKNTLAYAKSHGVSVEALIKRDVQKASEEGDKSGETSSNYYYDNGEIVEETKDKYVSGSKLVKAVHNMLNSGYTDKEIEYFYQKEYGSDDAFVWALQAGMDAKTYLQYREDTAMITADKDANGKSINGSKKEKMFNAINAMNISKAEKLLLFMRDYKLSTDQYREVFNYINSLNLSKDEKLELAERLGFAVEDGKVYMKKAS